jgi:hypothetical protein
LQTSCGRKPRDKEFTRDTINVEVLGVLEHYETIDMARCVKPKVAVEVVANIFGGEVVELTCTHSFSTPISPFFLVAALGCALVGVMMMPFILCSKELPLIGQASDKLH